MYEGREAALSTTIATFCCLVIEFAPVVYFTYHIKAHVLDCTGEDVCMREFCEQELDDLRRD